jgi:hypothetical protein
MGITRCFCRASAAHMGWCSMQDAENAQRHRGAALPHASLARERLSS